MDYLFGNGMLKKPNKYNIHERNVMQFDKICFVAATITLKPSLPHRGLGRELVIGYISHHG